MDSLKVGFVGFGEINSPQPLIESKIQDAKNFLEKNNFVLVSTKPVTDDPQGKDVLRALAELAGKDFDCLIVCLAGWIPSHAVISVTEPYKHLPIVLWGLCGSREGEKIVTTADQAGTTALRKVFEDLGYRYKYIYSIIGKPLPLQKIVDFARAAAAEKNITGSRLGMVGFRDMQLYGTLYDGISLKSVFGIDVDFIEMLEIVQEAKTFAEEDYKPAYEYIKEKWNFQKPVRQETIAHAVSYYLAVKRIVKQRNLKGISLKDVDGMKKLLNFPPAPVFVLISDFLQICTIPENDTLGLVTQLIVKSITGQAAAYLEFYEFFENSVLVGVPDYVPSEIVEGNVKILPASFGLLNTSLLNVSQLKTGQVTLARLTGAKGEYAMHIVTGEARTPPAWEEAGWDQPAPQLPGLEIFLNVPTGEFAEKVLSQHYIIAYGDHTEALKDFCRLKKISIL
jgi:hypothetical protein